MPRRLGRLAGSLNLFIHISRIKLPHHNHIPYPTSSTQTSTSISHPTSSTFSLSLSPSPSPRDFGAQRPALRRTSHLPLPPSLAPLMPPSPHSKPHNLHLLNDDH